jgi:hypothetical protein
MLCVEADDLLETAIAQSGLDDFGSDEFREPLGVLTGSLDGEARLTATGRFLARKQALTALTNRLRVTRALAENPTIEQLPVDDPLVIVGLPRSGTTLLQHLLARDPAHRVLHHWEAADPVPPASDSSKEAGQDEDPRIQAAERGIKLLDYLAPDARALHPVAAREPTECVTLFTNSLASLELATQNQVPTYLDWCLRADMAPHYRFYQRQLKLLAAHERRPRWLLKSPAHLFWIDELLEALPGARIIATHRDPLEVLGSFCSLSAVLCGIGSDEVDLPRIGSTWAPAWAGGLSRAAAARTRWPADRFVDVRYPELVADPLRVVTSIYAAFGLELTDQTRAAMQQYVDAHPQHKAGVHRYSLAQFGLDEKVETERFATYRAIAGV